MCAFRPTFVSHAHANNAQCEPFVTAFQRRGVPLYYDRANPQVGHDLGEALERELERATALIVMATPAALASFWVREEISIFFALMARDPSRLLIPIKLEPCELPARLAARWWVDATDLALDDVVDQVVQALALATGTQPPVTTPPPPRETLPPLGPAPAPANSAPAHHLTPMPLYNLGFRGYTIGGVECILPPLCPVPGGVFTMGSDKSRDKEARDDETPQYPVEVDAFALCQHPVTVAEYACAVRAKAVREPPAFDLLGRKMDWATQQTRPDHPVVCVSWNVVVAYCAWLATLTGQAWRLPTEAEWEKAARGADGRIYPWGDTFDKARCNTSESGIGTTTPVGRYPNGESPYHIQDMAGNVWEWTSSLYQPYPYRKNDGRENPDSIENRVLRGGSRDNNQQIARVAYRLHVRSVNLSYNLGFRLAWPLVQHNSSGS
ncbi:MAG TPA: SUMF1/EgtB/PvdO family nonheme iron enzyme [Ktedonobacterales bacterium]